MMLLLLAACRDDSFYTDPVGDLGALAPGDVVRHEHIGHTSAATLGWHAGILAPQGADIYRILYRTTGLDGGPDVASARLAVPDDLRAGAPLVAHLHGTTGLADRCAPSREGGFGFESATNPTAARMLARGAVVVEPDYLGLGPDGPHPYTAAGPTATSVLDGLRAASGFTDPERDVRVRAPDRVLLEGHSQGGHAVLATLREAPSYAPELPITAALAIAAPGAPRGLSQSLAEDDAWGGFLAMALVGWSHAHPALRAAEDWVADPETLERFDEKCLLGLGGMLADRPSDLLAPEVVEALADGDPGALGLEEVFAAEDLGSLTTEARVLLVHGTDDELLPFALSEALADEVAAAGTPISFVPIEGGDHLLLPWTARDVTLPFLEEELTR